MKRREFIQITGFAATAGTIPWLGGCEPQRDSPQMRLIPQELGVICSERDLMEIGAAYLDKFPDEADPEKLVSLIYDDAGEQDTAELKRRFSEKTVQDFENETTVSVLGWVLSQTEARQCALLYLSKEDT